MHNMLCSEVARLSVRFRWCIPFEVSVGISLLKATCAVSLRVLNVSCSKKLGERTWLGPHACRVFGHRTQKFSVSLGHIEAKSEKLSFFKVLQR